jgi:NTE family protein
VSPLLSDWLRERPFSLAMSSGFFSFFAHAGLLSVLIEEGFVPVRVSGSSAGALVTAAWAGGVEPEELSNELSQLERKHFWDPAFGPGFLRGALFQQRLDKMLAGKTFETARVPAAVSVFELKTRRTKVITQGAISTAIRASCAVPGLFHPVEIDGRLHWDGGVLDRPGLAGMPLGERVLYHHILSQSPWRIGGAGMGIPPRESMITLAMGDLPRSGPFRLSQGRQAYEVARTLGRKALATPIEENRVLV